MSFHRSNELIKAVLRFFPKAVVVSRKIINPESADGVVHRSLAKHAKPPRGGSRACKRKCVDANQLSLFESGRAEQ